MITQYNSKKFFDINVGALREGVNLMRSHHYRDLAEDVLVEGLPHALQPTALDRYA